MARLPIRSIRHVQRYREIAGVLIRNGFGELLDMLGLPSLALPQRLLQRVREGTLLQGAPARLRMALEELGPTFIKLGQVLSTRPDLLPLAYIAELSKLQDTVPPGPWEPVRAQIEAELGAPPEELFAEFDPIPIAAASLSQVHAAVLTTGEQVVVKVQRPDIQAMIDTDLEILFELARLLQGRTPLRDIYDLPGIAEEFAATLRAELDFCREGSNADRFRASFAGEPFLHIPTVYWDYTTRRVLVLERISGIKIDDIGALDAAGYDRHRLACNAARMIVKEVMEDAFFHADPHPGNFVAMPGEVIGAMDFGMVGHLSRRTQTDLLRLYVVTVQLDEEGIVDQLVSMGVTGSMVDRAGLRHDVSRLLRKYYGMPLATLRAGEVVEEIMPIAFRHHLHLPPDLWLLGKTLAMMEGIGLKLAPDFDIFAFAEPYVRRFVLKLASPAAWGPAALRSVDDWMELLATLPRVGTQLLARVERGELEVTLNHKGLSQFVARIDRSANRLTVGLLLAALIVGLAMLIPAFNLGGRITLATVLVIAGFVGASMLGLWLIYSIWRSRR